MGLFRKHKQEKRRRELAMEVARIRIGMSIGIDVESMLMTHLVEKTGLQRNDGESCVDMFARCSLLEPAAFRRALTEIRSGCDPTNYDWPGITDTGEQFARLIAPLIVMLEDEKKLAKAS